MSVNAASSHTKLLAYQTASDNKQSKGPMSSLKAFLRAAKTFSLDKTFQKLRGLVQVSDSALNCFFHKVKQGENILFQRIFNCFLSDVPLAERFMHFSEMHCGMQESPPRKSVHCIEKDSAVC